MRTTSLWWRNDVTGRPQGIEASIEYLPGEVMVIEPAGNAKIENRDLESRVGIKAKPKMRLVSIAEDDV
ncbi:MAG: hypothetical protein K7J46_15460 [Bryobacter sp.]|nr:hypothetical protein [Bryobacter sp. CoA8 C33]